MRIGERIGNYVLESLLGTGGQAEVFLARDVSLHRLAAVKVCIHGGALVPVQEARLLARLDHPGIVTVYHLERVGNHWYIALQYFDGGSVAQLLQRSGKLPLPSALAMGRDVAAAIAHAHSRDIVHGDLKPQNMLLSRSGRVSLIDFGLGIGGGAGVVGKSPVGTPHFMAHELWDATPPSRSSDVYALAVALCQLISGTVPFNAGDVEELKRLQRTQEPHLDSTIPKPVQDLLRGCLARAPSTRPAADELAAALDRLTTWARREERKQRQLKTVATKPDTRTGDKRLEGLLVEYASGAILEACVAKRLGETNVAAESPTLYLLEDNGTRMQQIAVERVCGRLEWRGLDEMLQPESLIESGQVHRGVVIGMAVPSGVDSRLLTLVGGCVTQITALGAHVVARGRRADIDILAEAAAAAAVQVARPAWSDLPQKELAPFVREWTALVTGRQVHWSWSALTRAIEAFSRGEAPLDRIMHNAVMLSLAGGDRVLTTWHVSGALAHSGYLLAAADIKSDWAKKPKSWPPRDEAVARPS